MRQWFCYVGGKKYGPMGEDALKRWISEGRVRNTDYVWSEGMSAWEPAQLRFPDLLLGGAHPAPPANSMVPTAPPGGTSGATPNAELMSQARSLLRGNWGLRIGFSLLLGLLVVAAGIAPYVGYIAQLILQGPLALGGVIFYMTFARGGPGSLGMLFAGFKSFGRALGAHLLMTLFIFLWMLLLIIPGIIASLRYSQTLYLLADNRSLGPLEAIRKSKQLMHGRKWKLFCLQLRFVGWSLLCILTLGIGFLWLTPYISVSVARFYDDIQPTMQTQGSRLGPAGPTGGVGEPSEESC